MKRGGSEIAKKQEIGRGLRLPVDSLGSRCTDPVINELTIIANDTYDRFAMSLQRDFNEQSGFHEEEVTADIILMMLASAGISLTAELVDAFLHELRGYQLISLDRRLTKAAEEIRGIEFVHEAFQANAVLVKEKFIEAMNAKRTKKIPIKNGDLEPVPEEPVIMPDERASAGDDESAPVRVQIDHNAFIKESITELNEMLRFRQLRTEFSIESGKASYTERIKLTMKASEPHSTEVIEWAGNHAKLKSEFEMVNYIMYHTSLPRLAIYRILSKLEKKDYLRSQDLLDLAAQHLKVKLKEYKADSERRSI